jgi:flagellar biosynthetic protein FliP
MIMTPTWTRVNDVALSPLMDGKITSREAYDRGVVPVRQFMLKQVRRTDLALFLRLAKVKPETTIDKVPTTVIIPAFIISELKSAFIMGFILYLPFLIIDMVVSSVLISMGMFMLPPVLISLPFKLMLFVVADGWNLVVKSLVESFH